MLTLSDVKQFNPGLYAEAVNIGVEQERGRFKAEATKKSRVKKHRVISVFGNPGAKLSPVQRKNIEDSMSKITNLP